MSAFGDYIVYVDESGDHGVTTVNPDFPLFVLAFCVFKISDYTSTVVPTLQKLKFRFFGHDMVVLHEREIRKSQGFFTILFDKATREGFFLGLNAAIKNSPFTVIACVIEKYKYREMGSPTEGPYRVAMEFGLGQLFRHLEALDQVGKKTFVVFESRGSREDRDLQEQFRLLMENTEVVGLRETVEFMVAPKSANSSGLQLADMVARPLGLHVLRPSQSNRSVDIILEKLRKSPRGGVKGWGLQVLP